jgi:hypothetical protein
MGIWWIAM